jgi:hypothetical protein
MPGSASFRRARKSLYAANAQTRPASAPCWEVLDCKTIMENRRYSTSKQKARPQPGFKTFILPGSTDYCVLTQPDLAFDHSY